MLKSILRIVGLLAALLAPLLVIIAGLAYLTTPPPVAGSPAQATPPPPRPSLGLVGVTEQNNCASYLKSLGYHVDAVGYPTKPASTPDTDTVVVLMPVESPQFDPGQRTAGDLETVQQVLAGLSAAHHFFPSAHNLGVGLEWERNIILLPSDAANLQAFLDTKVSLEELWGQVSSRITTIDVSTWQPVPGTDFLQKDFSTDNRQSQGIPPAAERPATSRGQIRLQPSTAYLASGQAATLITTVSNGRSEPIAGQSVEFSYAVLGQDPQSIITATTGANGVARAPFSAPSQAGGQVAVSVGTAGISPGASVPLAVGPPVTGTAALDAVTTSLRLQGYNVLNADYRDAASTGGSGGVATALAEMASPRLDDSVRAELLSMAGTLFSLFPQAAAAEPVLLYRSQGLSYQLVYSAGRQDWDAWIAGTTDEVQLWQRFNLQRVVDAVTGQAIDQRDFLGKSFGATGQYAIDVPGTIESRLVNESWGDQLYTAKFVVPVESLADTFGIADRTGQAEFAIYKVTDPTKPLYASSQDQDGSKLKQLGLAAGRYILSVESATVPASARLTYVAHMLDAARIKP
jgi:hypothetical protein